VISTTSALVRSCCASHSFRNSSLSVLSRSSLSRSGKNDVSTSGFLTKRFFLGGEAGSSSSSANDSLVFSFRFDFLPLDGPLSSVLSS